MPGTAAQFVKLIVNRESGLCLVAQLPEELAQASLSM